MAKVYYQIESGKVVSWGFGSDIANDNTSTKKVIQDWVAESPGTRSFVESVQQIANVHAKYMKPSGNTVVEMNQAEKDQVNADEAAAVLLNFPTVSKIKAPNGTVWKVEINNGGVLVTSQV